MSDAIRIELDRAAQARKQMLLLRAQIRAEAPNARVAKAVADYRSACWTERVARSASIVSAELDKRGLAQKHAARASLSLMFEAKGAKWAAGELLLDAAEVGP